MSLDGDPARVGLGHTASCGKCVAPGSWLAGACAGKGLRMQVRSGNPAAASGPSGLYVVSVTASGHLSPLNGAGAGGHRRPVRLLSACCQTELAKELGGTGRSSGRARCPPSRVGSL